MHNWMHRSHDTIAFYKKWLSNAIQRLPPSRLDRGACKRRHSTYTYVRQRPEKLLLWYWIIAISKQFAKFDTLFQLRAFCLKIGSGKHVVCSCYSSKVRAKKFPATLLRRGDTCEFQRVKTRISARRRTFPSVCVAVRRSDAEENPLEWTVSYRNWTNMYIYLFQNQNIW